MRYMAFIIPGARSRMEAGEMPDAKLIDSMMRFNEQLAKAGVLVSLDGFHPTVKGARVRFAGGTPSVTPGPFPYASEIIGGYWVWKVKSKEDALSWARKVPAEDGDVIELREIIEIEAFDEDVQARGAKLMESMGGGKKKRASALGARRPAAAKPKPAAKKKAAKRR